MKKFVLVLACIALMAAPAVAGDLADNLEDFQLSTNVEGTYFVNDTTTLSGYILSTANSQGDKVYGGGSFVSEVFEKDIAGEQYASSDLITDGYDSTEFNSGWTAR